MTESLAFGLSSGLSFAYLPFIKLSGLPLMLGHGAGSELRRPLGLSIFGGRILSQLLTLFTTPVIYLGFDRLARRWRPKKPQGQEAAA